MSVPTWNAVLDAISQDVARRGTQPLHLQQPPSPGADPSDQLSRFAGLLDRVIQAERQLELAPLPAGDTSWGADARPGNLEHNLRKKAVRARLELLGYSTGPEGEGSTLRQAVLQFQQDAGLDVDGWVGRQTWGALDEFITLEPPLQLDRWYPSAEGPRPALVRAVALRLTMLGFDAPKTDQWKLLDEPLRAFQRAAFELGLSAGPELPARQGVALLFDDELLLSFAARSREGGKTFGPLSLDDPETDPAARMLRRMVRAELWLHGYDVGPMYGSTQVVQGRQSLADGLRGYWSHRELPPGETLEQRSKLIDSKLFEALLADHHAPPPDDTLEHEHVARFMADHLKEFGEAWERTIPCQPVFFIWDGVKRCGRWLKKQFSKLSSLTDLVAKGVEYAKTFVWNAVRFVFQHGSQVLTTVRRAIAAFIDGMQPFLDGGIREGRGTRRAECQIALNSSLGVMIDRRCDPADASRMVARLERMSVCLQASSLILGEILRAELKLLRGPASWMSLLSHLVKEAPRWESYLERVADLPDLPPPPAAQVGSDSVGLLQTEPVQPLAANWTRRIALVAGVVLLIATPGVIAWRLGALTRFTHLTEWLPMAGGLLGFTALGALASWAWKRWFRAKTGL